MPHLHANPQDASNCYCGNSYGAYGSAAEAECNKAAAGNGSQPGGGTNRNSVYRHYGPTRLGCYRDNTAGRDLPFQTGDTDSRIWCSIWCKEAGYKFFGLQAAKYCFCGNSFGKYGSATNCDSPCGAQTCGGSWANEVYVVYPEEPTLVRGNGTGFEYLGCYIDGGFRDLGHEPAAAPIGSYSIYKDILTVELCSALCKDFNFFSLQNHNECFCGRSFGHYGKAPESDCWMPAAGNVTQKAGGSYINSVYRNFNATDIRYLYSGKTCAGTIPELGTNTLSMSGTQRDMPSCVKWCENSRGCRFYSWNPSTQYCGLYFLCDVTVDNPGFDQYALTREAISSPVLWPPPPNYYCSFSTLLATIGATTLESCIAACNGRSDCSFCTFYSELALANGCSLFSSCATLSQSGHRTITWAKGNNPTTCITPVPAPNNISARGVHITLYPMVGLQSMTLDPSGVCGVPGIWPPPAKSLALSKITNTFYYINYGYVSERWYPTDTPSKVTNAAVARAWNTFDYSGLGNLLVSPLFAYLNYTFYGWFIDNKINGNGAVLKARVIIPCDGAYQFSIAAADDCGLLYVGDPNAPYVRTQWTTSYVSGASQTYKQKQVVPIMALEPNFIGDAAIRVFWKPPGYLEFTEIPTEYLIPGLANDIMVLPSAINLDKTFTSPQPFCVNLTSPPGSDVTVTITNTQSDIIAMSLCQLTFTPDNWYIPQCVNATRRPGTTRQPSDVALFPLTSTSLDPNFNNLQATLQGYAPGGLLAAASQSSTSTCTGWGDVHMITYDNRYYDYMELGLHTITRDCYGDLVVQTHLYRCYGTIDRAVSCSKMIWVKVGASIFLITQVLDEPTDPQLSIVKISNTTQESVFIGRNPANRKNIDIKFWGGQVTLSPRYWADQRVSMIDVDVTLSKNYANVMAGLCGNFNANANDDMSTIPAKILEAKVPAGQELWRGITNVITPLSVNCMRLSGFVPQTVSSMEDPRCSQIRPVNETISIASINVPSVEPIPPPATPENYTADYTLYPNQQYVDKCKTDAGTSCTGVSTLMVDSVAKQCALDAMLFDPNGTQPTGPTLSQFCLTERCKACDVSQTCVDGICVDPVGACGVGCSNGGACIQGQCACTTGWTGQYCTTWVGAPMVNPCLNTTCHAKAFCYVINDKAVCNCNNGYTGDGVASCTDANECANKTHNCIGSATCSNTDGSFTCACNIGFAGDGVMCVDLNECSGSQSRCPIEANCTNTYSSFTCVCAKGFNFTAGQCVDLDECAANIHACSTNALCNNTAGSFACSCNVGYNGTGVSCSDVDECASNAHNCGSNGVCNNTAGSFACTCDTGYTWQATQCADEDECARNAHNCGSNGVCNNTAGSFACTCNTGYTWQATQCADVDECASNAHNCGSNGVCNNTAGSFACTCNTGYTWQATQCADVDECASNAHNCGSNGVCNNTAGSFACTCNTGYTWQATQCADVDECASNAHNCGSNGVCNNTAGSFACTCNTGYTWQATQCADVDECASNAHNCGSNGVCNNTAGSFACTCNTGYTWQATQCADVDECTANTHACNTTISTCNNTIGRYTCTCSAGYTQAGNIACTLSDACVAGVSNCHANATCTPEQKGAYTCVCNAGWTGTGDACTKIVPTTATTTASTTTTTIDAVLSSSAVGVTPRPGTSAGTCINTGGAFTAKVTNIGMTGAFASVARTVFANSLTGGSDGGYCLMASSPHYGRTLYNCNHPISNVTIAYDGTGTITIEGSVVRCGTTFSAAECNRHIDILGPCTFSFSYSVKVVNGTLMANDNTRLGGGTITCTEETITYSGKQQTVLGASLIVGNSLAFESARGGDGHGWLMRAGDSRAGDWLFGTQC